jgi:hypothetical protein
MREKPSKTKRFAALTFSLLASGNVFNDVGLTNDDRLTNTRYGVQFVDSRESSIFIKLASSHFYFETPLAICLVVIACSIESSSCALLESSQHKPRTYSIVINMDRFVRDDGQLHLSCIAENHTISKVFAERLSIGGELDALMTDLGCNDDSMKVFLEQQRQRLLHLATSNDTRARDVRVFVDVTRGLASADGQASVMTEETYEAAVLLRMKASITASTVNSGDNFHREIRSKLGYSDTDPKQDDDGDEDEELTVIDTGNRGTHNATALKCPLTGTHYENPVKNSVCGHVYSKEAIEGHLRCSRKCPVAGCNNKNVRLDNLVADVETQLRVRRQKRRVDAERQRNLSQSLDLDEDDDENETEI